MSGNSLTKTLYIKKDVSPAQVPAPTPVLSSHHVNKAQAVAQAQAQVCAGVLSILLSLLLAVLFNFPCSSFSVVTFLPGAH